MTFVLKAALFGILAVPSTLSEEIPTYFMHNMCGQRISLRRESVFMAKIELHPSVLNKTTQKAVDDESTRKTRDSQSSEPCVLSIESWSFQNRLMVRFEETGRETRCSLLELQLFDGPDDTFPVLVGFGDRLCKQEGEDMSSWSFTTTDRHLTFSYSGNTANQYSGAIKAVIGSFHYGPCMSYEHRCFNGRCIMEEIVCNGHNPCGDLSDCPVTSSLPSLEVTDTQEEDVIFVVILSVSISLVLFLAGFVIVFVCYRRRRKTELHHRQQQRSYVSVRTEIPDRMRQANTPQRAQPVYERTVSQIEADRRFAPPSYSQLPVFENEDEQEVEELDPGPTEDEIQTNQIELEKCLEPDENNPPSYACVMLHQDEFKLSEPNIYALSYQISRLQSEKLDDPRHQRTQSASCMYSKS